MKNVNVIAFTIAIAFVNLSQNQETSKAKHENIYIYNNNITINWIHPTAEYAHSESIASTKNIGNYVESLVELLYNATIKALHTNLNGFHSNTSEMSPVLISSLPNKDFIKQKTEKKQEHNIEIQEPDGNDTNKLIDVTTMKIDQVSDIDLPKSTIIIKQKENLQEFNIEQCDIPPKPINSLVNAPVPPGAWPWWAPILKIYGKSLYYDCGGTLISKNVVLSAAGCFYEENLDVEKYRVGLGLSTRSNFDEKNTFIAQINDIIIHPDYSQEKEKFDNNIAIIILKNSYDFNDRIQPACLWSNISQKEIENEEGYVVGFKSNNLKSAMEVFKTNIVPADICQSTEKEYMTRISERNFCGDSTTQTSCYSIYGQGLLIRKNEKLYLRGILLGGLATAYTDCNLNERIVYTDIVKFIPWITQSIRNI